MSVDRNTEDDNIVPQEVRGGHVARSLYEDESIWREHSRHFFAVMRNAPIFLFAFNGDGRFVFADGKELETLGFTSDKIVGLSIFAADSVFVQLSSHFYRALAGEEFTALAKIGEFVFEIWLSPTRGVQGEVVSVAGVATNVTQRVEVENSLRESSLRYQELFAAAERQAQEKKLLDLVRKAIASELDLKALFHTVVEAAAEIFGFTLVSLYIREGDQVVLQHQVGYHHVIEFIPITSGVTGRVMQSGLPVFLPDVNQEPNFLQAIGGIVSEVCVPLFDQSKVIGVLNVESTNSIVLSEDDLRLMMALSDHVSVAIARARLYTELKSRSEEITALYETSLGLMNRLSLESLLEDVMARACQLLETSHGYIYLLNEDEQKMEVKVAIGVHLKYIGLKLNRGEGLAGRVWETKQPIIVDDYSTWEKRSNKFPFNETRAVIGVPLYSGKEMVVGVLGITYLEPGRYFGDKEADLLTRFAQIASIALDNARLYASLHSELFIRLQAEEQLRLELSERKRAESALAEVNVELERALLNAKELALAAENANRTKGEFLTNISHELRTPLTAVLGLTELMLGMKLPSTQNEYLTRIYDSAELLLKLVNDLLDLSRIENGHLELEIDTFDVQLLVHQVVETFEPLSQSKGIKFIHALDANIPSHLVGDPVRLRQVLLNLLSNAFKFTEQGQIALTVKLDQQTHEEVWLMFAVSDTGIGVPLDKHDLIFDTFTQVDGSMSRRHGGSGLGLAIVRELVSKFGGRYWLESQVNSGSTFYFTAHFKIPVVAPLAEVESISASSIKLPPRVLNILVAEDNLVNRRVVTQMLEKHDWKVTVAEDGSTAVKLATQGDYDLILMDIQMPNLDGIAATAAIRASERLTNKHTPIVAFTAHAMSGDRERCLAAGMDGYLTKPMKVSELYLAVEQYTRK